MKQDDGRIAQLGRAKKAGSAAVVAADGDETAQPDAENAAVVQSVPRSGMFLHNHHGKRWRLSHFGAPDLTALTQRAQREGRDVEALIAEALRAAA